jgi:hypothetical protein
MTSSGQSENKRRGLGSERPNPGLSGAMSRTFTAREEASRAMPSRRDAGNPWKKSSGRPDGSPNSAYPRMRPSVSLIVWSVNDMCASLGSEMYLEPPELEFTMKRRPINYHTANTLCAKRRLRIPIHLSPRAFQHKARGASEGCSSRAFLCNASGVARRRREASPAARARCRSRPRAMAGIDSRRQPGQLRWSSSCTLSVSSPRV